MDGHRDVILHLQENQAQIDSLLVVSGYGAPVVTMSPRRQAETAMYKRAQRAWTTMYINFSIPKGARALSNGSEDESHNHTPHFSRDNQTNSRSP